MEDGAAAVAGNGGGLHLASCARRSGALGHFLLRVRAHLGATVGR
jgi:hypothetical protein